MTSLGDFVSHWATIGSSESSPKMGAFGFNKFLHSHLNKQFQNKVPPASKSGVIRDILALQKFRLLLKVGRFPPNFSSPC